MIKKERVTLLFVILRVLFCIQQNYKPGYVVNNHLSSSAVANRLKRPT